MQSSGDANHRYLCLCGVILELGYVRDVVSIGLEELKRKFFDSHPDDPIVFHRKELLGGKPPFSELKNEKTRAEFDTELLRLIENWNYTVISVCIDKRRHLETYSAWRYDPYHYCLAVLIERYVFFLDQCAGTGDVMAESRGGKEDRRLKDSFSRLLENGTDYLEPQRFEHRLKSKQLKVKNKANNIAGLQLTDLIAHPSRNEILRNNGIEDFPVRPFGQKNHRFVASKILSKRR